jgi:G3E family GTPase
MIKLYLITGFLGAGKTTFLKNFIRQHAQYRFKVIVNEFGKEGIDGALIKESGAQVEEISNGSIFCSCRLDQFENALSQAVNDNPDIILVETSGLSDPSSMETILEQTKRFESITYMGCVCLVDAVNIKKVLSTVRVTKKQLAAADLVLINKSDIASEEALLEAESLIRQNQPSAQIHRTTYGRIEMAWLENIREKAQDNRGPAYHLKDVSLQKMLVVIKDTMTYKQLNNFIGMFIEDTFRIKGFVCLEGKLSLVDCVGAHMSISPYQGKADHCNRIVALAGAGMPMEKSIRQAAQWYPQHIEKIEWD